MASGDTKTEALLNILGHGGSVDGITGSGNTKTQDYLVDAIGRLQGIQDEVDELKNNPDVVDIVDTYADLQAYDKSTLTDKDIIRVLEDSTHSNKSTYYRYSASTDSFTYIGEAGSSVTVVQTTGTSTTDVMSQNAVTSMVFADASDVTDKIRIGSSNSTGTLGVNIGGGASQSITVQRATNIGWGSGVIAGGGTAIGSNAYVDNSSYTGSVALGAYSHPTSAGQVHIGTTNTNYGYNSTNYRLLSGLYDPQTAHDAATKGYVDAHAGGASVANLYINMNDLPTTVGSQTADNNIYSDPELTQALTGLNVRNSLANNDLTIINIIDKVNGVYPIKTYATTSSIASAEDIEAYSGMDFWIPASSIDGSLVNHGFYVYFEGPESGIFQFSLV